MDRLAAQAVFNTINGFPLSPDDKLAVMEATTEALRCLLHMNREYIYVPPPTLEA